MAWFTAGVTVAVAEEEDDAVAEDERDGAVDGEADDEGVGVLELHEVAPGSENVYEGQAVQAAVVPPSTEKEPAGHGVQDEVVPLPVSEKEPPGHGEHDVLFTWSV